MNLSSKDLCVVTTYFSDVTLVRLRQFGCFNYWLESIYCVICPYLAFNGASCWMYLILDFKRGVCVYHSCFYSYWLIEKVLFFYSYWSFNSFIWSSINNSLLCNSFILFKSITFSFSKSQTAFESETILLLSSFDVSMRNLSLRLSRLGLVYLDSLYCSFNLRYFDITFFSYASWALNVSCISLFNSYYF